MRIVVFLLMYLILVSPVFAQEKIAPLRYNVELSNSSKSYSYPPQIKRAALPFFDDFSYQGVYPNPALWMDSNVYINNTMGIKPITRGVATFDALNKFGNPYNPTNPNAIGIADSLTSKTIDLSTYSTSSNIYLSFYYQPQGNGFAPETQDSLFLYFRNNSNQWIKVWQMKGTTNYPFKIVLLPVTDPQYLHTNFQFRFTNIASINTNDDVWNIDYVKIDAGRNDADSIFSDVAFTTAPTSILSPYTSMPYRQFFNYQSTEKATSQTLEINNQYNIPQSKIPNLNVIESNSLSSIYTTTLPTLSLPARTNTTLAFSTYPISYSAPTSTSLVIFKNKYFINNTSAIDPVSNDTIVDNTVFDNYFAYDDGTAEKAYFLLPSPNTVAKTAIQFHLNQPDTVRGLMVRFAAQAPMAIGKYFSIVLYKQLGSSSSSEIVLHQEDFYQVNYTNALDGFTTYAFASPQILPAGTYYMGINQPPNFGSDSIYFGLDVNTNANTNMFNYNVDGTWYASTIQGSVMFRPVVGQAISTSIPQQEDLINTSFSIFPNPVSHTLYFTSKQLLNKKIDYSITSLDGKKIRTGSTAQYFIDVHTLNKGVYFLNINNTSIQKFIKE